MPSKRHSYSKRRNKGKNYLAEDTMETQAINQASENKQMLIHPDMTVGDIVEKYPQCVEIMLNYGLHCVGCGASPMESLRDGAEGHGIPSEMFDEMVEKLNEAAAAEPSQGIVFTDKAVAAVKDILIKENKKDSMLRVGIVPGGCSGMSYDFSFADKVEADDSVFEFDGMKVVVDKESLEHLNGAQVDFVSSLQGSGFKISNPKAKHSCGCGNSFA